MTYAEKLKDPRWQKKRLEILNRDKFTCQLCGDHDNTLHVHHNSYGPNPWDSKNNQLITYCLHCHSLIEWCKENNIQSVTIKVIKDKMLDTYFMYALHKSSNNAIGIYLFEFNIITNEIDFRSVIFPEIIEVINKELIRQKRRK